MTQDAEPVKVAASPAAGQMPPRWHWLLFAALSAGFFVVDVIYMSSWLGAAMAMAVPVLAGFALLSQWRGTGKMGALVSRYLVIVIVFTGIAVFQQKQNTAVFVQQIRQTCLQSDTLGDKKTASYSSDVVDEYCRCFSSHLGSKMVWPLGVKYLKGDISLTGVAQGSVQETQSEITAMSDDAASTCGIVLKMAKKRQ